ncbi:MAG: hypothetical protein BWY09_00115 [Candidatus Hydrogenedentes bacterium ADurb.Bin179]|nr:MAG: hypothetical protein BWY09_00115 [Candidatus Hydrogenedentes bacterium ADurb.Bin179]
MLKKVLCMSLAHKISQATAYAEDFILSRTGYNYNFSRKQNMPV